MDLLNLRYIVPSPSFMAVWGKKLLLDGKPVAIGSKVLFMNKAGFALNRPFNRTPEGLVIAAAADPVLGLAAGDPIMKHCPIYGADLRPDGRPRTIGTEDGPKEGATIRIVIVSPDNKEYVVCKEVLTWSNWEFIDLPELTSTVKDDVTDDGVVDLSDIQALLDKLNGLNPALAFDPDVTGDGLVDISDVMKLADRVMAGLK